MNNSSPASGTPSLLLLFLAMALGFVTALPSCSAPKTSSFSVNVVPKSFSLSIYRYSHDGKHTYLTLSPDGELAFAGGRAAIMRLATPILTLTPAQRQEIWAIVIQNDLLGAPDQHFKSADNVEYNVEINTAKSNGSKKFRVVDDHIPPGLIALHDRLFALQGNVQYKAHLPSQDKTGP